MQKQNRDRHEKMFVLPVQVDDRFVSKDLTETNDALCSKQARFKFDYYLEIQQGSRISQLLSTFRGIGLWQQLIGRNKNFNWLMSRNWRLNR